MRDLEAMQRRNDEAALEAQKQHARTKERRALRRERALADKQRPRRWVSDFEFSLED